MFYTTNSQFYNPNEYTDNVIGDFNFLDAERFERSDPKEHFFSIQENIVDSEHYIFDVGVFSEEYKFFTQVTEKSASPEDGVLMALSFFMNQDTIYH